MSSCANCNHFLARGVPLAKSKPTDQRTERDVGVCRRMPPRAIYDPDDQDILSVFPAVNRAHRCGEIKTDFMSV